MVQDNPFALDFNSYQPHSSILLINHREIRTNYQSILVHNIKLIPLYSYYTEKLFFRQFALVITTL